MKKALLIVTAIASFACSSEKKEKTKAQPEEKVLTTGLIVINLSTNEYAIVALERTIKDTLKLTTTDSSGGKITQEKKIIRDTSYRVWWPYPILDSSGKVIKSKVNPAIDSTTLRFAPILNEIVIQDYNKNWKLK